MELYEAGCPWSESEDEMGSASACSSRESKRDLLIKSSPRWREENETALEEASVEV